MKSTRRGRKPVRFRAGRKPPRRETRRRRNRGWTSRRILSSGADRQLAPASMRHDGDCNHTFAPTSNSGRMQCGSSELTRINAQSLAAAQSFLISCVGAAQRSALALTLHAMLDSRRGPGPQTTGEHSTSLRLDMFGTYVASRSMPRSARPSTARAVVRNGEPVEKEQPEEARPSEHPF